VFAWGARDFRGRTILTDHSNAVWTGRGFRADGRAVKSREFQAKPTIVLLDRFSA
jgi:hypothetical protein